MLFGMEPRLVTAPELANVLAELSRLEPIFHWPSQDMSRAALEEMTVEDFWETGASGRRYAREFVLDVLEQRMASPQPDVWETSDFYCRRLADDVYLLTYTLLQDRTRLTRRATIWQRAADGWKIVYHQGTAVSDSF
jgi:Uncharacterized protein conserved in bacteria